MSESNLDKFNNKFKNDNDPNHMHLDPKQNNISEKDNEKFDFNNERNNKSNNDNNFEKNIVNENNPLPRPKKEGSG